MFFILCLQLNNNTCFRLDNISDAVNNKSYIYLKQKNRLGGRSWDVRWCEPDYSGFLGFGGVSVFLLSAASIF